MTLQISDNGVLKNASLAKTAFNPSTVMRLPLALGLQAPYVVDRQRASYSPVRYKNNLGNWYKNHEWPYDFLTPTVHGAVVGASVARVLPHLQLRPLLENWKPAQAASIRTGAIRWGVAGLVYNSFVISDAMREDARQKRGIKLIDDYYIGGNAMTASAVALGSWLGGYSAARKYLPLAGYGKSRMITSIGQGILGGQVGGLLAPLAYTTLEHKGAIKRINTFLHGDAAPKPD